ncbi:hypothetical protein PENANT_c028G02451 [Penicillium antarcticum]|uniref:Mannosyltransferase n=1 Tax=Penicillium antarcticum TaxID=416450 RepID=A0A1V6PWF3_9EURO|nr:hypothetical protein PENANT_c028G02451 [Penicillium antarcticum]
MSTPTSPRHRATPIPHAPTRNILLFLVAFRLLNAFTTRTFFQPDEYFQSLEPAWQIAFGPDQGAWLTWEWRNQLRSSLHPLIFAALYKAADFLSLVLHLSPATRAELLIAAPKTAQAVVAAIGDFYTWKLAVRVYGDESRGAWTTLAATVLNPWQWFCSTRTLSNCLETTITIVALELWPWQWSTASAITNGHVKNATSQKKSTGQDRGVIFRLHKCLPLAAIACILRPTNILVWATLGSIAWLRTSWAQRRILVAEVLVCGSAMLAVSAVADRLFYGIWTFPPLRFLYFNIAQSLAVFYGNNNVHYYATEGYPLLLTTLLPFAVLGLYRTLTTRSSSVVDNVPTAIRVQLATVCLVMPFVLSLISHKEVRFIYPLLPSLHILAAPPLVQFFYPAIYSRAYPRHTPRRLILIFLVFVNLVVALYTTIRHASGPLSVLSYLRQQHEAHAPAQKEPESTAGISAGFLMPCHSTPWRSHLVYPTINAWALSCEPPIDQTDAQKSVYRDEADQFYDDPSLFLRQNMAGGLRHLPHRPSYASGAHSLSGTDLAPPQQHEWPDYLIFFAQLEPTLHSLLRGSSYGECKRIFNTDWHDDWRRRGDIVVWCLDPKEQDAWRAETQTRVNHSREKQFDRIMEAFRKEMRSQQKRGWAAKIPSWSSLSSWPSSRSTFASSFASWQRSAQSLFTPRSSSIAWPWRPKSRWETFLARFRMPARRTGWIPSWGVGWVPQWPPWLQGKKKSPLDRDLWS